MNGRVGGTTLAMVASAFAGMLVGASPPSSGNVFHLPVVHAAPAGQEGELPRKGYLGVRLAPVPDDLRAREHLETGAGVLVEAVVPGTTAEGADVRPGDVVLAVDGRKIRGVPDFIKTVAGLTTGQRLEVTLLREGRRLAFPLTVRERPRDHGENFEVLYHHVVSGGARIRTRCVLAIWGRNDFIATEADHPLIAEIVNKARPGKGTYTVLEGSDHGFRTTASVEDSFRRWKTPGDDFNPQIIATLKQWTEKLRIGP